MNESLSISVHPLVVLNVSDHYTRSKVRQKEASVRSIGIILGRQDGRIVEFVNSIETRYD